MQFFCSIVAYKASFIINMTISMDGISNTPWNIWRGVDDLRHCSKSLKHTQLLRRTITLDNRHLNFNWNGQRLFKFKIYEIMFMCQFCLWIICQTETKCSWVGKKYFKNNSYRARETKRNLFDQIGDHSLPRIKAKQNGWWHQRSTIS